MTTCKAVSFEEKQELFKNMVIWESKNASWLGTARSGGNIVREYRPQFKCSSEGYEGDFLSDVKLVMFIDNGDHQDWSVSGLGRTVSGTGVYGPLTPFDAVLLLFDYKQHNNRARIEHRYTGRVLERCTHYTWLYIEEIKNSKQCLLQVLLDRNVSPGRHVLYEIKTDNIVDAIVLALSTGLCYGRY